MAREMTVDISRQMAGLLEKLAAKEGREPCAILRRAVGLYADLQKKYYGQTVTITDEKGRQEKLCLY